MVTLEVSEGTFQRIQRFAIPLKDTADTVLGRILDAAEKQSGIRPPQGGPERPAPASAPPQRASGRRERTNHILLRKGLFEPGTRLSLLTSRVPGMGPSVSDDPRFHCRVSSQPTSRYNVIWEHDGQQYSLSALTEKLRDDEGIPLSGGALNGYAMWASESNPRQSLWELANTLSGGE